MIAIEIDTETGQLTIQGTADDLHHLANWVAQAAVQGRAEPAFITDQAKTSILIERLDS